MNKILSSIIVLLLMCTLIMCTGQSGGKHADNVKMQQYFVQGERLYELHCSNCHQKGGTGLGRVYPPLNKSDFVDTRLDDVLCLMKNGIQGKLIVNGKEFNQAMKAPHLTDLEIAEIATFVYNSWGREKGIIEVTAVTKTLSECAPSGLEAQP